jgi:hypothetical protein
MLKKIFLIFCLTASIIIPQSSSFIKNDADKIIIGNNYVERVISLAANNIGTTQIINRISGKVYNVK